MKFIQHDIDGVAFSEGEISAEEYVELTTHGGISVEVSPGVWINVVTSEWAYCFIAKEASGWPDLKTSERREVTEAYL